MTFWDDIVKEAGEEPIEAVVIGEMGWADYGEEGKEVPADVKGTVLSADAAERWLSYEYSTGFGAPECHAVNVWTPTRVVFVSQYDGSTAVESVPRNPTPGYPTMPGGG